MLNKKLLSVTLLIACWQFTFSQGQSCGTKAPTEEYLATQRYIGNNSFLIDVLKKNGLYLPLDYFNKLDSRGLYEGKELKLEDVKDPNKFQKSLDVKPTSLDGRVGAPNTTYYIPVKVWVYQNSAGNQAITQANLEILFNDLNLIFRTNGVPIELYFKCPVSFITNDQYYIIDSDSESDAMWNDYYDGNAMNVHIVKSTTHNKAGRAQNPGKCLYINASGSTIVNTLAHEFGHNFGLDHTHNGAFPCGSPDYNENCADCWQEPVSRSLGQPAYCGNFNNKRKCEVNGDKLCDTPGEPNLFGFIIGNCQYDYSSGDQTDNWGATWTPDTHNIMSYSTHACRTRFTYGQIGVILNNLPNFAATSPGYSITGLVSVCPNQPATYSVPQFGGVTNYFWQIPAGWTMTGQGTRIVSITPTLVYGDHTIYVSPMCGQAPAKLVLDVNNLSLDIFGPDQILDDSYPRSFTTEAGATNYNWTAWPGFFIATQNTYSASIGAYPGTQPGYINVSASACGYTIWGSKYVTIGSGGPIPLLASPEIIMFPNPVDDILNVKVVGENFGSDLRAEVIDMLTGKTRTAKATATKEINFDLSTLPSGFYIVRYSMDGKSETKKIIKK